MLCRMLHLLSLFLIGASSSSIPPPEALSPGPPESVTHSEMIFEAYDCSKIKMVKDVGYERDPACAAKVKVTQAKNATYQLLQKPQHHRTTGRCCSMTKTTIVRYCGNADHQTAAVGANSYDVPTPVTKELCKRMWDHGEYYDNRGRYHKVEQNTVNILHYEQQGRTTYSTSQVSCEGAHYRIGDVLVPDILVEVSERITLWEEIVLTNRQEVVAFTSDKRLPCKEHEGGCQVPMATYLWDPPDRTCELGYVQDTSGVLTTNSKGRSVYMSTDGTLMRFVLEDPISYCGKIVWSTNYPDYYLYDLSKGKTPFTAEKKIDIQQVSLHTYVKNRDDYLFNTIIDRLEDEMNGVLQNDCKRKIHNLKQEFWHQYRDPGLVTWLVGDGIFATVGGEVIYKYRCNKVMVKAVKLDRCFLSLPVVHLTPEGSLGDQTTQWFMEPLTRRLTVHGIEAPCSNRYLAKYRNANGNYIMVTPNLHRASAPDLPADVDSHGELFPERPDFSKGGLYPDEMMEQYENFQDFGRTQAALTAQFVRQIGNDWHYEGGRIISPEQLFPELNDPRQWASKFWSKTTKFLHWWGETSAIVLSLFFFYRVLSSLLSICYSIFVFKDLHGCTRQMLWTPCPEAFLLKQYKQYNRARKEDDKVVSHEPSRSGSKRASVSDETTPKRRCTGEYRPYGRYDDDPPSATRSPPGPPSSTSSSRSSSPVNPRRPQAPSPPPPSPPPPRYQLVTPQGSPLQRSALRNAFATIHRLRPRPAQVTPLQEMPPRTETETIGGG